MKRLLLPLLLGLCFAPSAWAQVALDTESVGQCGNTGSLTNCSAVTTVLTISHTTSGGSNMAMGVFVKASGNSGCTMPAISTVTYNTTQVLSETATVNGSNAARYLKLFSLAAGTQPASGAHNLVVTWVGDVSTCTTNTITVTVFTASGVDQSTTYTATNTNSGNSAGPATVTLASSGANDKGIMGACVGDTFTGTLASGLTQEFKYDDTATGCSSDMIASSTGGTTVHSANLNASDSWLIIATAFKTAGGAAAATRRMTLLGVGP